MGQFIGSPILGSLSDDYGRKKLLSGSLLLSAFCNLFTGIAIAWQNLTLIFYEFGPVHLTLKWELGPSQLVLYNGILCLSLALGSGVLAHLFSTRISNRLAVLVAMGAIAFMLIGIALVDSVFPMMLLFALSGLLIGLTTTLLTVKISDSVSETIQGEVMGVQMSLRVLGDAMICLLGGVLLLFSSKLILMVAAGICMMTLLWYALGQKSIPKLNS